MKTKENIAKANGKLGILTPGMGAVSTTFMAGVIAANKGLGKTFGSYTQMGKIPAVGAKKGNPETIPANRLWIGWKKELLVTRFSNSFWRKEPVGFFRGRVWENYSF